MRGFSQEDKWKSISLRKSNEYRCGAVTDCSSSTVAVRTMVEDSAVRFAAAIDDLEDLAIDRYPTLRSCAGPTSYVTP